MKKSQSWSFDVVIATAVFFGIFMAFFVLLQDRDGQSLEEVKGEAEFLAQRMKSSATFQNGQVTQGGMEYLADYNYTKWKALMGVKNDFCIYLEDEDGNIIPINDTVWGVGSPKIEIGGVPCS